MSLGGIKALAFGAVSSGGGGGSSDSFTTIQTDFGTFPVATSPTDTLTFTSSNASVTITGNNATDTIDFTVAASTGAPNTLAYFDSLGNLTSLPGTTVNEFFGTNDSLTIVTPPDAGDVNFRLHGFETEINPAVSTTQYHPYNWLIDLHIDRTGTGNDINDVSNVVLNMSHEGDGTIASITELSSALTLGNGNTGTATQATHLNLLTSIGAGYTVDLLTGISKFFNIQGSLEDLNAFEIGVTGDITGNLRGMIYNHVGNIGGDATVMNYGISGDVTGNAVVLGGYHNGNANNLTLLQLGTSGGTSHGNVQGINLGFNNAATTGKIALSLNLGGGTSTGGGRFMELNAGNGVYNGFIGINSNHNSIDPGGGGETAFQAGKSTLDAGNYQAFSANSNGPASGSFTLFSGGGYPNTGTTANYYGLLLNPGGGTVSNSVQGATIQLDNVIYTGQGFKQVLNTSGGMISSNHQIDTGSVTLPGAIIAGHNIQSFLHIDAGFPITTAGPLTPQFSFLQQFGGNFVAEDDYDPDFTGARLGLSFIGTFGQIAVVSGKTVDMVSMMMAGASIPSLSTGGTITQANCYRALGFVPDGSGGTLTIDELIGYWVDPFFAFSFGTDKWGIRVDADVSNYVTKLAINSPDKKNVGVHALDVFGETMFDAAIKDGTDNETANFNDRHLIKNGNNVLDWNEQKLRDNGGTDSVFWDARLLKDSGGNTVINWSSVVELTNTHFRSIQTTPPTVTANAGAGTGATASLSNATDTAGEITLTTGTLSLAAGSQLTVTYNTTYATAPLVIITPADTNAALAEATLGVYVTRTTTGFDVNFNIAPGITTAYLWNYFVIETQ